MYYRWLWYGGLSFQIRQTDLYFDHPKLILDFKKVIITQIQVVKSVFSLTAINESVCLKPPEIQEKWIFHHLWLNEIKVSTISHNQPAQFDSKNVIFIYWKLKIKCATTKLRIEKGKKSPTSRCPRRTRRNAVSVGITVGFTKSSRNQPKCNNSSFLPSVFTKIKPYWKGKLVKHVCEIINFLNCDMNEINAWSCQTIQISKIKKIKNSYHCIGT